MPPIRRATAADYPVEAFADRTLTATLVVPTLDEGTSVAHTVMAAKVMHKLGVVDRVLVVDGGSSDDTMLEAELAGADVLAAATIRPDIGPVLGKGDQLWRALDVVDTDVVAFLDADLEGDIGKFVRGLLGPLMTGSGDDAVRFVKGSFHRLAPDGADSSDPFDGGRVTEMMARPLLNLWRPDLAGFYQPLSGQVAARTDLLRTLPLLTGYAVEMAMLIDVVDHVGLDAVVEVDLGTLRNRSRSTAALAPMAQEVLYAFASRVLPQGVAPPWAPYARPRRGDGVAETAPGIVVERPAIRPA